MGQEPAEAVANRRAKIDDLQYRSLFSALVYQQIPKKGNFSTYDIMPQLAGDLQLCGGIWPCASLRFA